MCLLCFKERALCGGCCSCLPFSDDFPTILTDFLWAAFPVLLLCLVRWCRHYLKCSNFGRNSGWVHCFFFSPPCLSFLHNLQLYRKLWWCLFKKKKTTELSDLRVLLSVCFHSANRLFLPELSCELFQGLAEMVAVSVNKTLHVMSDVVTEMWSRRAKE